MSNPILKDLILKEIEKCKAVKMSRQSILEHISSESVSRALQFQSEMKRVK